MVAFFLRRSIRGVITLWGVVTAVFFILRLSGDPVALLVPADAPLAYIEQVRHQLGFDRPLIVQYGIYMRNLLLGDFGESVRQQLPVVELVLERLPKTLELAAVAFAIAVAVAIPLGLISALRPNGVVDNLAVATALLGQSTPTFFIGIVLILVFGLRLSLFPVSGTGTWQHLILPAVTLAAFSMASIARLTRSAFLEVLRQDYIRVARAKGLKESAVVMRHAFKNAAIPIITITGLQLGSLLSGAIVTEQVFAWPGIGLLAINAIYNRDYPVVQAVVIFIAAMFVVLNLLTDLIYAWLDPRMRVR